MKSVMSDDTDNLKKKLSSRKSNGHDGISTSLLKSKKWEACLFNNYRTISVLPFISKVFKKNIFKGDLSPLIWYE